MVMELKFGVFLGGEHHNRIGYKICSSFLVYNFVEDVKSNRIDYKICSNFHVNYNKIDYNICSSLLVDNFVEDVNSNRIHYKIGSTFHVKSNRIGYKICSSFHVKSNRIGYKIDSSLHVTHNRIGYKIGKNDKLKSDTGSTSPRAFLVITFIHKIWWKKKDDPVKQIIIPWVKKNYVNSMYPLTAQIIFYILK